MAYSLLFRIAAGEMLGLGQPVILQLLDLPSDKTQQALRGVALELADCALPLLHEVVVTSDPFVAFRDASHVLLVGSMPRGPGMERADLLQANGRIFVEQGRIIDEVAGDDVRVVVVGNPCNTNRRAELQGSRVGRPAIRWFVRATSCGALVIGWSVPAMSDLTANTQYHHHRLFGSTDIRNQP